MILESERIAAKPVFVCLDDQAIELRVPSDWLREVEVLFAVRHSAASPFAVLTVTATNSRRFSIADSTDASSAREGLDRYGALIHLSEVVASRLAGHATAGVALHAAAVERDGRSVLIPGPSGAGKSSLAAWFVDKGFSFITDELVLASSEGIIDGLARALVLKPEADRLIDEFAGFAEALRFRTHANLLLRPPAGISASKPSLPCRMIIFPKFSAGARLSIRPVSPAKACVELMACNVNARNLSDGGFSSLSGLCRAATAIELEYGSFQQLDGVVETLTDLVIGDAINASSARSLMNAFERSSEPTTAPPRRFAIPAKSPPHGPTKLTIGMATYDDYDGVYFSLQALRIYHPEVLDQTEFVVIDNHPDGPCSASLKALEDHIGNYRYVPEAERSGTAVRSKVFEEAAGEIVMCMDSHVFILPRGIKKLLDYFSSNPDSNDLVQGPLVHDDLTRVATHLKPEWRGGMFGTWDDNGLASDPDAAPFEIPMQGLGVFACRRTVWPGFNAAFRGFGGEEGYIHEKFRRAGGRTLCLPSLRWIHRFARPMGIPYRNRYDDRIWNYLVGLREFGLPPDAMQAHFRELLGAQNADEIIDRLEREIDETET